MGRPSCSAMAVNTPVPTFSNAAGSERAAWSELRLLSSPVEAEDSLRVGGAGSRGGGTGGAAYISRKAISVGAGRRSHSDRKSTRPELQSQSNLVCRLLLEKKKNCDISICSRVK